MIPSKEFIEKIQKSRKQMTQDTLIGKGNAYDRLCSLGGLLNASMGALAYFEQYSGDLSEMGAREFTEIHYCTPIDIINVLDHARKLLPYEEMEFVDEIADLLENQVS